MLLHEEIVDVRFLDKFAVDPKYCLPFVDLFTWTIYIYAMKNRNLLKKKLNYCEEMRMQTDQESEQSKIKKLSKKYTVQMFSTKIRGGKAFAPKQKIMEFKKLLCKSKAIERRLGNRIKTNKFNTKCRK